MSLPNGLIAFGPHANCTLDLCPLTATLYEYLPSVPANSIFIALYAVAMGLRKSLSDLSVPFSGPL